MRIKTIAIIIVLIGIVLIAVGFTIQQQSQVAGWVAELIG